jgi:RNA polymerase sigma-70 factor (ECF subfamily)
MEQTSMAVVTNENIQTWTDEELLEVYRDEQDRFAFEELVRRYERELYNYLRRYLNDAELAEDAFQATFLKIHLKCDTYESGRPVRPWLYKIATNKAIDAQRRNRRQKIASLDYRLGGDSSSDLATLVDTIAGTEMDPLDRLEFEEEREAIRAKIRNLTEAHQKVLHLVYFQGLKYREAAEILDIPVGTVRSQLHAAIRKLHDLLTADPEEYQAA